MNQKPWPDRIRTFRDEAIANGDASLVELCERALRGEPDAMQKCKDALQDGDETLLH